MNTSGFIKLFRKIFVSKIWSSNADLLKLWIWIMGQAQWCPSTDCEKGSFYTTGKDMQEALTYYAGFVKIEPELKTIYNYIEALKKLDCISTSRGKQQRRGETLVKVLNYSDYQDPNELGDGDVEAESDGEAPITPIKEKKFIRREKKTATPATEKTFSKTGTKKPPRHWCIAAEKEVWPLEKDRLIKCGSKYKFTEHQTYIMWSDWVERREASDGKPFIDWIAAFRNQCKGVALKDWYAPPGVKNVLRQCNRPDDPGYDENLPQEIRMWRNRGLTDDQIREKGIELRGKRG